MLRLLLLCGALGCGADQEAPLTFTMLQRTRVSKGISVFWGNASLDGRLSHLLEGLNVTQGLNAPQVLPLEPPSAWARRQQDVASYLLSFSQLVKLFIKERPIN
ncbi:PREDICTED: endothelial protein C receptor-like, partial [Chlamydotis macqueenii]|uniref:endothelial protein C receptor-like n=1 Tax=Chlamydotis macqueenii TaxID=187382 RepID=UPI000529F720